MKKKSLFSLVLLSSCLFLPNNNAKAMFKNVLLRFYNGKPVINKPVYNVMHSISTSSRSRRPAQETKISPLVYDTSHLTGADAHKKVLGSASINFNQNGKNIILAYDSHNKKTIILQQNSNNKNQNTIIKN